MLMFAIPYTANAPAFGGESYKEAFEKDKG